MRARRTIPLLAMALLAAAPARADEPQAPAAEARGLISLEPGRIHSGIRAVPDPTQTYELYLPSGFHLRKRWPLLLVFDPRRRGALAAEIFRPAAERWGWIVASSNDTQSDTPTFDHNIRAVNAMWPDLTTRLPIDPERIYAAGFSGGAILSWIVGQQAGLLAGVVSVGGRPPEDYEREPARFPCWLAAGRTDFNFVPTLELAELAARGERPWRFEPFEGAHTWFDSEQAGRALAWLEIVAMREGRRPVDAELARAELDRDLAGADALLAAGDALSAQRRLEAIAATWRGLADVGPIELRARELERSPAVERDRGDERWGAAHEAAARSRLANALHVLRNQSTIPSTGRFRELLNVPGLQAAAELGGRRGDAGRRALASVHVQLSFYQLREMFVAGEYARAIPALEVAIELQPANATDWYNLACARARLRRTEESLDALERAVELGLPPWIRPPADDPDLESLRGHPRFARILAGPTSE